MKVLGLAVDCCDDSIRVAAQADARLRDGARGSLLAALVLVAQLVTGLAAVQAVEEVKASHILTATKEQAVEIRKEIVEKGGDFQTFVAAAREHSMDVTTKVLGGDLGWFPPAGAMEPEFAEAAFRLKIGEISEPVKTSYGWHLIYLVDRRQQGGEKEPVEGDPSEAGKDEAAKGETAEPGKVSDKESGDPASGEVTPSVSRLPKPPAYNPAPPILKARSLVLKIESVQGETAYRLEDQNIFDVSIPVQLNLILKNAGKTEQKVPVPELLPFGFELTRHHDGAVMKPDFKDVKEPASLFTVLASLEIVGWQTTLNDYFKDLTPSGRYRLRWDVGTLFRQLEERFPKVKEISDYAQLKNELAPETKGSPRVVTIDTVRRDPSWRTARGGSFNFSIFARRSPTDDSKLYSRIKIRGETDPVFIELDAKNQLSGVEQFTTLAMDGFYDNLNFYEIVEGDYLVGGCPKRNGTGDPGFVKSASNTRRMSAGGTSVILPHERGTVSFVGRSPRRQTTTSRDVGSVFFVCLKEHPEWDERHIPFGKVVSGLEVLEGLKPGGRSYFESITILTEYDYLKETGALEATGDEVEIVTGNPEAVIKTAKGELQVTLYETAAPNTVANFISLAEKGFYDKGPEDEKQTFFRLVSDDDGKLLIMAGSPTNDPEGDPGYKIPDETKNNTQKCVRGALVMTKMLDQPSQKYIVDSAGSQFFICLRDVPYYDYLGEFTVFGKVTGAIDELDEGDEIDSIRITKKRKRDYEKALRKVE